MLGSALLLPLPVQREVLRTTPVKSSPKVALLPARQTRKLTGPVPSDSSARQVHGVRTLVHGDGGSLPADGAAIVDGEVEAVVAAVGVGAAADVGGEGRAVEAVGAAAVGTEGERQGLAAALGGAVHGGGEFEGRHPGAGAREAQVRIARRCVGQRHAGVGGAGLLREAPVAGGDVGAAGAERHVDDFPGDQRPSQGDGEFGLARLVDGAAADPGEADHGRVVVNDGGGHRGLQRIEAQAGDGVRQRQGGGEGLIGLVGGVAVDGEGDGLAPTGRRRSRGPGWNRCCRCRRRCRPCRSRGSRRKRRGWRCRRRDRRGR